MRSHLFRLQVFCLAVGLASAGTIINTGSPDGLMAAGSQPSTSGKTEIEAADDFLLNTEAFVSSGHFTGLITGASPTIGQVAVEIYRVFPNDSGLPSGNVPTRVNSPSDVAFDSADTTGVLSFTTLMLNANFTAANSVLNGINKLPNQTTGGEGAVSGEEVQFSFALTTPFDLPADHYFFVPQVQVTGGQFYWLSSPRPDTTTVFSPDLQAWVRNANLAPDWLRIGTDVVGGTSAPQFNMSFDLQSTATPEPSTLWMLGAGVIAIGILRQRRSVSKPHGC
jgi:PEP-CTERM motif